MSAIVVLGAGPAGLLAGLEAAEAGHQVTILEAAPVPGGMSASFSVAGQRVDLGSHRLHPATDPAHMERIRSLLGPDLQARQRNGRIRIRDRWVGFPLRAVDMVRSLPPDFSTRVAFDTAVSPLRRGESSTFASEIVSRLGPTIYREFYEPYARKLYGARAEELDRELADRRVASSSALDILKNVARAAKADGRVFWYPKHGYGQIVDRLVEAAVDAGVDLRLSTAATSIDTGDAPGRVVGVGDDQLEASTVLSTIPLAALARIVSDTPPEVGQALSMLRTRAMVLVYVVVPQHEYAPFDAHYFPELDVGMARLSEPKNYRTAEDPAGQTVLCAEYACWAGDATWTASDSELGDRVVADLARAGLPVPQTTHVETRRLPHVYPVFEPGTAQAREVAHNWVEGVEHVLSLGRQGLGVPDNLHHVMAMASASVRCLDHDGHIDRDRWQAALKEFAAHVVQD